jgi:hypothetical protein
MLRITTHENGRFFTFQLEGKLAGPWVQVLRDCWEHHTVPPGGAPVHVDLRAVTFVDDAGRALLAEMSEQNAQFYATDCQMKAIVAEIRRACD